MSAPYEPTTSAAPVEWKWEDHVRWIPFEALDPNTVFGALNAIDMVASDDAMWPFGLNHDYEDGRIAEIRMSDRSIVKLSVKIELDPVVTCEWVKP